MLDYDQICRVARRLGRPPFDWRDLAQESALHALLGRKSIKGPMQDLIRRHALIGWYRSGYVNKHRCVSGTPATWVSTNPDAFSLPIIMPRLQHLIDELPVQQRRVLRLQYWSGLRQAEIAEQLGLTQARISQIHTEAIQRLRVSIQ
jgi:RNA polymerase sigma factor (sigma-70 family)